MKNLKWSQILTVYIGVAAVGLMGGLGYVKQRYSFSINLTESLPNWGYLLDVQEIPQRGSIIMFVAPENPYYDQPFGKRVVGVAGDRVENRDGEIYVAGQYIGRAKPESSDGRQVEPIADQIIPEGFYFVAGDHIDSYDSRYAEVGLIPHESVIAVAYPVL